MRATSAFVTIEKSSDICSKRPSALGLPKPRSMSSLSIAVAMNTAKIGDNTTAARINQRVARPSTTTKYIGTLHWSFAQSS